MSQTSNNIVIKINTDDLVSVVASANLGEGSFSNPIVADSFSTVPDLDIIETDEAPITFSIEPANNSSENIPSLECVLIKNVTKSDIVLRDDQVQAIFQETFVIEGRRPDGSGNFLDGRILVLDAEDGVNNVSIGFDRNTNPIDGENVFFAYTTIFRLNVEGIPYCFQIDPIYRVRRRG